jgi:hypothetical protein
LCRVTNQFTGFFLNFAGSVFDGALDLIFIDHGVSPSVLMGWNGMGWDGMGWDGMGWDGMGWDGMGWDGMAALKAARQSRF